MGAEGYGEPLEGSSLEILVIAGGVGNNGEVYGPFRVGGLCCVIRCVGGAAKAEGASRYRRENVYTCVGA